MVVVRYGGRVMKKRAIIMILIGTILVMFSGCGTYTCMKCKESTTKAYYDMSMNKDWVMCEDCARKYWTPLPIENYRVK